MLHARRHVSVRKDLEASGAAPHEKPREAAPDNASVEADHNHDLDDNGSLASSLSHDDGASLASYDAVGAHPHSRETLTAGSSLPPGGGSLPPSRARNRRPFSLLAGEDAGSVGSAGTDGFGRLMDAASFGAATAPARSSAAPGRVAPPPRPFEHVWFTSLDMVAAHVPQAGAPDDLVCEECESGTAAAYSEELGECLCVKCCGLMYPRRSTGAEHHKLREASALRALGPGDSTGARQPTFDEFVYTGMEPLEVTEDDLEERGTDLSLPTALEAPAINVVGAETRSNASRPLLSEGCIVIVDVTDVLPDEPDPPPRADWRPREAVGLVMATPHPTSGAHGHAMRRGDGHEPVYRLRLLREVTRGAYDDELAMSDAADAAANRPMRPALAAATAAAEAAAAADAAAAAARKYTAGARDGGGGGGAAAAAAAKQTRAGGALAPFAREKHAAWSRDAKLKEVRAGQRAAVSELTEEMFPDEDLLAVVAVPESVLSTAGARHAWLREARLDAVFQCLECVDGSMYFAKVARSFDHWIEAARAVAAQERFESSNAIQGVWRAYCANAVVRAMKRKRAEEEYEASRKVHQRFKYLSTEEQISIGGGYTVNGKQYFRTLHEAQEHFIALQKASRAVKHSLLKCVASLKAAAFLHFKKNVRRMIEADAMPRDHLEEARTLALDRDAAAAAAAEETATRVWHPAVGIDWLPPLPKTFCKRSPSGGRDIEHQAKHRSFRGMMAGPSDASGWLIKGRVAFGAYPRGRARRFGRQPVYKDSIEQMLLNGIGTLVCLMEDDELAAYETDNKLAPLERNMKTAWERLRNLLQSTIVKMQTALFMAQEDTRACPRLKRGNDRYFEAEETYREKTAKERLAVGALEKAKLNMQRFPKELVVKRFAIPDGHACSEESLLELLEELEADLRGGQRLLLFSALGHGRVGMVAGALLGRLYGCGHAEALERVQLYHDSMPANEQSGRAFSCPQSVDQASAVQRVLAPLEAAYANVSTTSAPPTCEKHSVMVRPSMRGAGLPVLLSAAEGITWAEQNKRMSATTQRAAPKKPPKPPKPPGAPPAALQGNMQGTRGLPRPKIVAKPSMRSLRPETSDAEYDERKEAGAFSATGKGARLRGLKREFLPAAERQALEDKEAKEALKLKANTRRGSRGKALAASASGPAL